MDIPLHVALWLLIQGTHVELKHNARFYSQTFIDNMLRDVPDSQSSFSFSKIIKTIRPSGKTPQIYTLTDQAHRMVLNCAANIIINSGPSYRSCGNVWLSKINITILKGMYTLVSVLHQRL